MTFEPGGKAHIFTDLVLRVVPVGLKVSGRPVVPEDTVDDPFRIWNVWNVVQNYDLALVEVSAEAHWSSNSLAAYCLVDDYSFDAITPDEIIHQNLALCEDSWPTPAIIDVRDHRTETQPFFVLITVMEKVQMELLVLPRFNHTIFNFLFQCSEIRFELFIIINKLLQFAKFSPSSKGCTNSLVPLFKFKMGHRRV